MKRTVQDQKVSDRIGYVRGAYFPGVAGDKSVKFRNEANCTTLPEQQSTSPSEEQRFVLISLRQEV